MVLLVDTTPRIPPHLILGRHETGNMIQKWRPLIFDGHIITNSEHYTRSRVLFASRQDIRGVANEHMDMFLVACAPNSTMLMVTLWGRADVAKEERYRHLQTWHTTRFPQRRLNGAYLKDEEERSLWWASKSRDDW